MSSWALAIANERWWQYTKCYTRCSNNRGRYLELNAYWYLSLGLAILSANVDPEEADKANQGLYHVCTNYLSAEFVQYVVDNVNPTLASIHDFMERWLANV